MYRNISPFAPSFRRCWITARMGATPVPGPTHIIGVSESSGRATNPFETPTNIVSPIGKVDDYKIQNKTATYQEPGYTSTSCILLSAGLSTGFCNSPLQRKDEFLSGGSGIALSC